jgi:Bacterial protein of unknown function (DUF916)
MGRGVRRSHSPPRLSGASRTVRVLLAFAFATVGLYWTAAASAASAPGLVVIPHPASGAELSYFKLLLRPKSTGPAGTIELRNPTNRTVRVALAAVDGLTLDTLGSSYAQPGSKAHGATRWVRVGRKRVTLAPGASAAVPVSVAVPRTARPGDYLSGVSIEALDQAQSSSRRGVSIASVERYAIGVETSLPGARHPAIRFTGAELQRQPAGLTFLLDARNPGNVILQGIHGGVRVTRAGHTILSRAIEPGTFVPSTRIAYPVPAFGQTPSQGTRYRVTAWLSYAGGTARLDTTVSFGHRQAVIQQQYGGSRVSGGGIAWWKIALAVGVVLYALATTVLLLRRRARPTASG